MACQVLLKRTDNRGEDGMTWKRGDPVVVMPERWVWGTSEDPATSDKFYVLRIPDMDVAEAERWLLETVEDEHAHEEDPRQLRLRRQRLDLGHMPQEWEHEMEQEGNLERAVREIRPHVRDMVSGQYGTEEGPGDRGV